MAETTTERLLEKIAIAQAVPVTQLRAHWDPLAKEITAHMRRLEETIVLLQSGAGMTS